MPGKGSTKRSSSSPRERPNSSNGRRPQTANNENTFMRSTFNSTGGRPGSSNGSRPNSASGPRVGTLNLSGGGCNATKRHANCYGEEKCICGICTCGRHRCPVQARTSISYGDQSYFGTTHGDAFINHDTRHYQPTRATRDQVYIPGERFEHTTTHQNDFPWHERPPSAMRSTMEKATPNMLHHSHHGPDVKMDLTTTYGSQFFEKSIPTKSCKPAQATYSYGSPRELLTTKQLDFGGLQPPRCPASVLPARPGSARSGHVKYNMDLSGTWS